ncbi:MAG: TonB-dependent receptor, partial [Catalinimonas sp.]
HLRWEAWTDATFRASAGRGFRVANPVAQHPAVLASARRVVVPEALRPERAWNVGGSLDQSFRLADRPGGVTLDYYYTPFDRRVMADFDAAPDEVRFVNLIDDSDAHSAQVEARWEVLPALDLKAAYKFYDVRATLGGRRQRQPFVSRHRLFANAAWATRYDKWKLDATMQWYGRQRLPEPPGGGEGHAGWSPAYATVNAQVTKQYRRWALYVGAENLLNFRQPTPVLGADAPFGPTFDASRVWGPIVGRMLYAGVRLPLK